MSLVLRPYQDKGFEDIRAQLRHVQATVYVSPCGSGKGTLVTKMVQNAVERTKRIIFAVHGKALVHDMHGRVGRLGINHGVLVGGHRRERWHPVQVASIDTLHRMEHKPPAHLLVVDEAHMAASPTWRKVIEYYAHEGWIDETGKRIRAKVVGLTATPVRLDKKGLGRKSGGLFDSMVLGPREIELIGLGFLVGSEVLAPPPPAELSDLKMIGNEVDLNQGAAICDQTKVIGDIVEHWQRHGSDRKAAAFGFNQAHAYHIAEQWRLKTGCEFAYVDAETPDSERERIWNDLDYGRLAGVSSVGCLSVGWDHPCVKYLAIARKTASLGLWKQILGRGSRPYKDYKSFYVADHVGNTHAHAPYGFFEDEVPWSLDGPAVRKMSDEEKALRVTKCKTPVRVDGQRPIGFTGELSRDGKWAQPCYQDFRTGPPRCPFCGLTLPRKEVEIATEAGDLSWMSREELNKLEKMRFLKEMKRVAKTRGFKEGWARHQYEHRFKEPVPREWMSESWQAEHPVAAPTHLDKIADGLYL